MENKQSRLLRQKKEYKRFIRELKKGVMETYQRKVQKDAYYINYNNIVEEVI